MEQSARLSLSYLAPSQSQKHVTVNETFRRLDQLVQGRVLSRSLAAEPAAPAEGDAYILPAGKTGSAWAGLTDLHIAAFQDGAWTEIAPPAGMRVWVADTGAFEVFDGAAWVSLGGRERLAGDRTYYVNGATGSDANDGHSAATAFATIQKAATVASQIDLNAFTVTIEVAAGTYTENITLAPLVAGKAILKGDTVTPSNVEISGGSGNCIKAEGLTAQWKVEGFKLTGTHVGVECSGGFIELGVMEYATTGVVQVRANFGGTVRMLSNYTISASAQEHIRGANGAVLIGFNLTVTLSGTPNFSSAFARVQNAGFLRHSGMTFSGTATGKRYQAESQGGISTEGGGANYFPGSSAGSVASGGQYTRRPVSPLSARPALRSSCRGKGFARAPIATSPASRPSATGIR